VGWKHGYEQTPQAPADLNQLANLVGRIATGEAEEQVDDTDPKARKRGEARAKKLTPERRREIVRKAAAARRKKE
jgi:acyl-CoA reductase-like NAD-dependent aldehyde dehydrogenase